MIGFVGRRLMACAVLVVMIAVVTFLLAFSATGNVARNLLGENATADQLAAKNAELGLDQPLLAQLGSWAGHALRGDLGISWFTNEPVSQAIANRLPVTLSMVVLAVACTALISVCLGVAAAVRGGWLDRSIQVLSVLGFALPNFWVALVLVVFFSVSLGVLPATGYVRLSESPGGWASALVLPVASLVIGSTASAAQQVRGAVIDVLRQDFVRTLRARGLSPRSVLFRHALRNAASPALTVLSLQFIALLGGAVVIEKVFAIPGLGTLTINAALQGDVPVLMGVVVTLVVLVVIVNLAIDVVSGWVNPKVRVR
ncbi:ABC transporter permease [Kribbella capetownensis]|uniref:ABC transporter permease n=1 Tax=Kribbella capetownensis TaxID=1572659 RepID=A0A4R0JDB7_9ACTN|nr:ABC transporter permease [Kribbella capetownensis]TCC44309.1 ABC transporter permease [Kribbella capetownensis]